MQIKHTYEKFDFFDGVSMRKDCSVNAIYDFSSYAYTDFKNAEIHLEAHVTKEPLTILLFAGGPYLYRREKYLSTFRPPEGGFEFDDLKELAELFGLPIRQEEDGIFETSYSLVLHLVNDTKILVVYNVCGGRAPEGVAIHAIYEVDFSLSFYNKYFTKK